LTNLSLATPLFAFPQFGQFPIFLSTKAMTKLLAQATNGHTTSRKMLLSGSEYTSFANTAWCTCSRPRAVWLRFYVKGILKGEIKPHTFTRFVWGLLTAIAFFAQVAKGGGGPGAWVTDVTAVCSFAFAVIGLSESSRVLIAKNDWIFFIVALLAIPIWPQ
jgi:hypothetical protein